MVNTPISSTTRVDMSTSSLIDTTTSSVMTPLVSPAPVVTTSVIPSPTPLTGEQDHFLLYAIIMFINTGNSCVLL